MSDTDFAALLRNDVDPPSQLPAAIIARVARLEILCENLQDRSSRLTNADFCSQLKAPARLPALTHKKD